MVSRLHVCCYVEVGNADEFDVMHQEPIMVFQSTESLCLDEYHLLPCIITAATAAATAAASLHQLNEQSVEDDEDEDEDDGDALPETAEHEAGADAVSSPC